MNRLLTMLLVLGCAACTTTAHQTYRPASDPNMVWKIEGSESALGNVEITINGEAAVSGKVSLMSGEGQFTGSFQGETLTVKCGKGGSSSVRSRCVISRGDERIAVLVFKSI